ncbi:hypothetical protein Lac2_24340 [Claveliimonas bilis]|nr:hypothetical protein Lac2_10720 [Claveliimonas bilis]BDZ83590.1 hypothetical protein Lac2_17240 [Claveliimonas bilis]BDZ83711.1 hypothetical protein Lac2_18450 [Claveliimonas bilis]BDZ83866.1 hypothetical protein Lac2_20000 [Claveliimonas bilis]BDZ84300.1 hypothetical protein Lac2_24340 [Claveliimonas bilis]
MLFVAPAQREANAAFGNETMDMRIPFQIPAKGMKDTDKTRSKAFSIVIFEEHTGDDAVDSRKEGI